MKCPLVQCSMHKYTHAQKYAFRHALLSFSVSSSVFFPIHNPNTEKLEIIQQTQAFSSCKEAPLWPQRKPLVCPIICACPEIHTHRHTHLKQTHERLPLSQEGSPKHTTKWSQSLPIFMSPFSSTSPFIICWIPLFMSFLSIFHLRWAWQNES